MLLVVLLKNGGCRIVVGNIRWFFSGMFIVLMVCGSIVYLLWLIGLFSLVMLCWYLNSLVCCVLFSGLLWWILRLV